MNSSTNMITSINCEVGNYTAFIYGQHSDHHALAVVCMGDDLSCQTFRVFAAVNSRPRMLETDFQAEREYVEEVLFEYARSTLLIQ
jgi:hypothetical protein